MTKYEQLLHQLDKDGVLVDEKILPRHNEKLNGLYYAKKGQAPVIMINGSLPMDEKWCQNPFTSSCP